MKGNKQKTAPIQRQLMRVILLTSGVVLLLTCAALLIYEYITFRQTVKNQLIMLGEIIAANSTAALAFDSPQDAQETLHALRTNPHIVAACLYDKQGMLFATYPLGMPTARFPQSPQPFEYRFANGYLEGLRPVVQGRKQLGLLYLKSDLKARADRVSRDTLLAALVVGFSFGLAYLLSRRLQRTISQPILALAQTAAIVSREHNYTVRATKYQEDEIGLLTDAFNYMLTQIDQQNTEILALNQQLEEKIKARTNQLEQTNTELTLVNSKLVKSNQDLEQFAYVASHDLQEPLRKIQTFAELVETSLNDAGPIQGYVGKIRTSAERMSALIKSVLYYSRLSNVDQAFTDIDLNVVVKHIQTDFELLFQDKKATLLTMDLPVIPGIPLQINQLFSNLISNALKFSDKDPLIRISATVGTANQLNLPKNLATDKAYVELVIEDNGIGFETHYADKIFTIFQRLHGQQKYPGTGIGLALCKKIVENHQGAITVSSELGKGTTFFIYLPAYSTNLNTTDPA